MSAHKRTRRQGGFTLIEMLTGLVVTSIVLSAVAAAVMFSQRSYQLQAQSKTAVEGGRIATDYLERMVRMAGYGLDPRYAFDFGNTGLPGTTKDNFTFAPAAGSTAQPFFTDDLAFRYRDPTYLRRGLLNAAGTTLTLDGSVAAKANFGVAMRAGQPLLIVCPGGARWYMAAFSGAVAANATTAGVVPYANARPNARPAPPINAPTCALEGAGQQAYVMLIQERRVRIIDQGGRSFLVAYNSLNTNSLDFDPLAVDVENFQVSYVMNQPPPTMSPQPAVVDSMGNSNWILGDAVGETLPTPNSGSPALETAYADTSRFTTDSANIRGVRVSIGTRSAGQLGQKQTFERVPLENFTPPALAGNENFYYRAVLQTTIRTGNLLSRAMFIPPNREPDDLTSPLNHDGA